MQKSKCTIIMTFRSCFVVCPSTIYIVDFFLLSAWWIFEGIKYILSVTNIVIIRQQKYTDDPFFVTHLLLTRRLQGINEYMAVMMSLFIFVPSRLSNFDAFWMTWFTLTFLYIFMQLLYNFILKNIRIYHDFVHGQRNPPKCKRFAVHGEACGVMDVANNGH